MLKTINYNIPPPPTTSRITTLIPVVIAFVLLNSYSVYGNNIQVAVYGGCLNRTKHEEGAAKSESPAFHCHFDSSSCVDGEEWLNQFEIEEEGLGPCTCDHNYKSNVYVHTCYDVMGSHQLICGSHGGCPEQLMDLGERYNSDTNVSDDCGHGDNAFGAFTGETCGKRCTCSYVYKSGDSQMSAGETSYGVCRNTETNNEYCAVRNDTCAEDETFLEHWNVGGDKKCPCTDTLIGACVENENDTFSHCAVASDGCKATQRFLRPSELRSSTDHDVDCRVCKNTWEPTAPPTQSPAPKYKGFESNEELVPEMDKWCANPNGYDTTVYGNVENWNVSEVTDMTGLLYEQSSMYNKNDCDPDIGAWDVSKVTTFKRSFWRATYFNQDIGQWDTSSATTMSQMFSFAYGFNKDLSGWDVSKVKDFAGLFWQTPFNQPIGSWDVSSVTHFAVMFEDNKAFNQDISGWDVSRGIQFTYMFRGATSFNQDLTSWPAFARNSNNFCTEGATCRDDSKPSNSPSISSAPSFPTRTKSPSAAPITSKPATSPVASPVSTLNTANDLSEEDKNEKGDPNLGAIIGGAVGGVVGITVLFAVILLLKKRDTRENIAPPPTDVFVS